MQFMFANCNKLKTLNIANFVTTSVDDIGGMFASDNSLETIYCNNNWNKDNVEGGGYLFSDCTSLKGTISYDKDKVSLNYANPDTGYFTRVTA